MNRVTVLLEAHDIPATLARKTRAEEVAELPNYLRVKLNTPAGLSLVNYGPDLPPFEYRAYPWFKTKADGSAEGVYAYTGAGEETVYSSSDWKEFLPGSDVATVLANVQAAAQRAAAAEQSAVAAQNTVLNAESQAGQQAATTAQAHLDAFTPTYNRIAAALGFQVQRGEGRITAPNTPTNVLFDYTARLADFSPVFASKPTLITVLQTVHNNNPVPIRWVAKWDTTGITGIAGMIYSANASENIDVTISWLAIGV